MKRPDYAFNFAVELLEAIKHGVPFDMVRGVIVGRGMPSRFVSNPLLESQYVELSERFGVKVGFIKRLFFGEEYDGTV